MKVYSISLRSTCKSSYRFIPSKRKSRVSVQEFPLLTNLDVTSFTSGITMGPSWRGTQVCDRKKRTSTMRESRTTRSTERKSTSNAWGNLLCAVCPLFQLAYQVFSKVYTAHRSSLMNELNEDTYRNSFISSFHCLQYVLMGLLSLPFDDIPGGNCDLPISMVSRIISFQL